MNRTTFARASAPLVGLLLVLLAAGLGGCGRKVGDACRDNIDCNNEDITRTCDLSQPGGYCTIDFCDESSCPGESVCVRFFPAREFLSAEPSCDPAVATSCDPQEICVAFTDGGRCAPRSTEKRNCVFKCDTSGDCRDGYICRETGQGSTVALTGTPGATRKFCSPPTR